MVTFAGLMLPALSSPPVFPLFIGRPTTHLPTITFSEYGIHSLLFAVASYLVIAIPPLLSMFPPTIPLTTATPIERLPSDVADWSVIF